MNHRGIRNLERYNEAREKEAKARRRLISTAVGNIVSIIHDHDGELTARNKVEALDILIRHGVFGASSKFPVRVSRHRKQEHHLNIAQAPPTEIPDAYQEWYAIVIEALDQLESAADVTIENSRASYVIRTAVPAEKSSLLRKLEMEFGHVVETPDPVDPDEIYHPLARLEGRHLQTVGREELIAY